MSRFHRSMSICLVVVSLMCISLPAFAGELYVANGGTSKYLFNISSRTTAPTFSIRPINTAANHTANVKLNYNDLLVGSTYYKYSNAIGLSGSMTEQTLCQNPANFSFVPGRSDRAQIALTSTYGDFAIRVYMN